MAEGEVASDGKGGKEVPGKAMTSRESQRKNRGRGDQASHDCDAVMEGWPKARL